MFNIQKIAVFIAIMTFYGPSQAAYDDSYGCDCNRPQQRLRGCEFLPAPKEERKDVETIRILSVDGGGVRGMVPTAVIAKIEQETGEPISKTFHMVGGTSAGCMLTATLTTPDDPDQPMDLWKPRYSANDLINILYKEAPKILRKRWIPLGSIYDSSSFEEVMDRHVGNTLFNQSIIPTVGVTFDILAGDTKAFCSWDEKEKFLRRDIILSSAAVPLLFYPRVVSPINFNTPQKSQYFLVDGGVKAGNPTAIIIREARKLYPKAKRFEIVSLGVGTVRDPVWYGLTAPLKALSHLGSRLIDFGLNLQSSVTDEYVQDLVIGHYTRINPVISSENASITNTSAENLKALEEASNDYLEENAAEFKKLIKRLKKPKD